MRPNWQTLGEKIYQNQLSTSPYGLFLNIFSFFWPNDGIAEDLLLEKPQMIQNTHCCPYVHIIEVILPYCSFAMGKENNNNLAINRLQLQTTIWRKLKLLFSVDTAKQK